MATVIPADDDNGITTKKRKTQHVVTIFGYFDINAHDYNVLKSIEQINQELKDSRCTIIGHRIGIRPDDRDRRVRSLSWDVFKRNMNSEYFALPKCVIGLDALEKLDLDIPNDIPLPPWIGEMKSLKELSFCSRLAPEYRPDTSLSRTTLPEEIGNLTGLKILRIFRQEIQSLPSSIGNLKNLEELEIYSSMKVLPEEIGNLTKLKALRMNYCGSLECLPRSIGKLKNLEELSLETTYGLLALPDEIGDLTSLRVLRLNFARIKFLPASVGNLKNLEEFHFCDCKYSEGFFPDEIRGWVNLRLLDLRYAENLRALPDAIGDLTKLEALKLANCNIQSLPGSICNLSNLRELDCRYAHELKTLPDGIANLTRLETLQIMDSGIDTLPRSLSRLKNLRILHLGEKHLVGYRHCMLEELVKECPLLGDIGHGHRRPLHYHEAITTSLGCSLVRNRIRSRVFFPPGALEPVFPSLSLWPHIFRRVERAVRPRHSSECSHLNLSYCGMLTQKDSIYELLVDHGGRILSRATPGD
jgi:Leucine-rich repeat (LRR) protein